MAVLSFAGWDSRLNLCETLPSLSCAPMPLFATTWPWIGLGAAGILLILLAAGDGLAADRTQRRWLDMGWLTWLGIAVYLIHQFEEHGVDMLGRPYAFRGALCAELSYRDPIACPVPLSFITSVNVGGVWLAGILAALLAPRRPLLGLSFFAVPLVNIFAHAGPAVMNSRYNPGLLTATSLFAPLCLWVLFVAVKRYGAGLKALLLLVAGGLAVHGVLLGSLMLFLRGYIGPEVLSVTQALNGLVPLALMYFAMPDRPVSMAPARPAPRAPRRRAPKPAPPPVE